ncbi:MAG: S8 family serine peptidase [Holophagales bacterium]|nr:S8 family serine peptidase [Holophagales bacterium]
MRRAGPRLGLLGPGGLLALAAVLVAAPAASSDALSRDLPAAAAAKIAPWVLAATEQGGEAPVLVLLEAQADLSKASAFGTKEKRGRFVTEALRKTAGESQAPLLARLAQLGVPHRSFYVVNAVALTAPREVVVELASRPDVRRIEGDARVAVELPKPEPEPILRAAITAVEPGITQTRAPEVWATGKTGVGIVVAGQDTGISWTHPALQSAYRGWNGTTASHDYNWHDSVHTSTGPCGANAVAPCDDNQHGTHTIGTVAGLSGANQIGMAPGAKWIGCRNMDGGNGTPSTYLECFEFFLAPYPVGGNPAEGDPAKAPHVTNNSWGCPASEGCAADSLRLAVAAQRAAGIFTSVSAGNSGSGCSTVSDPPAIYADSWVVGALSTGTTSIASFSSRGPVTLDGSGRTKPDIAAPGTSTRSSLPGGGYGSLSGTSMASPHVAGAVALLWSAQPALIGQVAQTERILGDSAILISTTSCGSTAGVRPNNVYGWGSLDVKAAVDLALVRPIVVSLSPATGPGTGGTAVTIIGTNFSTGATPPTVLFGGVASPSVVVNTSWSLVAVTPPHAAGAVDVTVTNPGGTPGTLGASYSYLASAATSFHTVVPCRAVDTRWTDGPNGGPILAAGQARSFPVGGTCGIPTDAVAVAVNLTAAGSEASGSLTVYSPGGAVPAAATTQFLPGRTRANWTFAQLGSGGSLGVSNGSAGSTHALIDVSGYFK